MKITLERLREIITEEVIKEELAPEIAAPAIAAMLQGMEPDATSDVFGDVFTHMYGEEALEAEADKIHSDEEAGEKLPTEYQPGGAFGDRPSITLGPINEIIKEEYYIYLIEQELRKRPLTEVKFKRIYKRDGKKAKEAMRKAQLDTRSKESRALSYVTSTNPAELKRAEDEGLGELVYIMSNPIRQDRYDRAGGLSKARKADLEAADRDATEQAKHGRKVPATTEPARTYKTASDQPASTSRGLDWFMGRWRDFIKSASPEEFRAEVDRSKQYLPDGKSIIEYLEAFLSMLRNRYQHDYQTA